MTTQQAPIAETLESTGQTKPVTLPDGRLAVIRKLTWSQMKHAAKAASSEQIAYLREIGADLLKALRTERTPGEDEAVLERMEALQRAQSRKPSQYEMATTLHDGLVSIDSQAPSVIGLDAPAAEFLHDAIVKYAWEVPGKNA